MLLSNPGPSLPPVTVMLNHSRMLLPSHTLCNSHSSTLSYAYADSGNGSSPGNASLSQTSTAKPGSGITESDVERVNNHWWSNDPPTVGAANFGYFCAANLILLPYLNN